MALHLRTPALSFAHLFVLRVAPLMRHTHGQNRLGYAAILLYVHFMEVDAIRFYPC